MFSRLVEWVRSLVAGETAADGAEASPERYRCTACGERLQSEPERCPVCRGTDFAGVESGTADEEADGGDGLDPGAVERTTADADDDAVERLRRLREERTDRNGRGKQTGEGEREGDPDRERTPEEGESTGR